MHAPRNRKKFDVTDVTVVPLQLRQSEASATRLDCRKNKLNAEKPMAKIFSSVAS